MKNWKKSILSFNTTLRDAIKNLNSTGLQFIAVVCNKNFFYGTITDGDIRRYLIKNSNLDVKIKKIANKKSLFLNKNISSTEAQKIMKTNQINCIPILNSAKKIVKIISSNDTDQPLKIKNLFIIMAGGKGKRLMPLTKEIPKPMIKISDKPIIERLILNARNEGFRNFNLTVNYLADRIIEYFKDGKGLNIKINYSREKKPLGTAGPLSKIKKHFNLPIVVTNGDIVNDVKFSKILEFHKSNKADMTVATGIHELTNPYGVIEFNGLNIKKIVEKPITKSFINAGIYVINSKLLLYLKKNTYLDMPNFISSLIHKKKKIIMYPLHESWVDIGTLEQLNKALKNK